MFSRRSLLVGGLALSAGSFLTRPGRAAVARALSLPELVGSSDHSLVSVPIDAFGQWERMGDRDRIVTYTTVHIEQALDGRLPDAQEVTVRTLGGVVGDIGQVVPGEAMLALGEPAVTFLTKVTDGLFAVTGMSQGHYRLLNDTRGTRRLNAPGNIGLVAADANAAVRRLHQLTVGEAAAQVQKALRDAH